MFILFTSNISLFFFFQLENLNHRTIYIYDSKYKTTDFSNRSIYKHFQSDRLGNTTLHAENNAVYNMTSYRNSILHAADNLVYNMTSYRNTTLHAGNNAVHNMTIAFMVFSGRDRFENRRGIRETWGLGLNNLFFIIGKEYCKIPDRYILEYTCTQNRSNLSTEEMYNYVTEAEEVIRYQENVTKMLFKESSTHGDIVLVELIDVYRNLPQKLKLGYEWIVENTNSSWILKVCVIYLIGFFN